MKMKAFFKSTGMFLITALAAAALILGGCGGGGGGGSDGDTSSAASLDTGSVSVFLKDGPSDNYHNFWVWLKAIKIYSENKNNYTTVFKSEDPDGHKIDLLDLRDREMLLGVKKKVRSGLYSKIAMEFGRIKPEGPGICADEGLIANKIVE